MVIAPDHPIIEKLQQNIKNMADILEYRDEASKKSEFERTELIKEKNKSL